jgi:beta-mannanase
MNGNWFPWSLGSTATDFVIAWRHVYNIFSNKSLDPTRLQWVWCVNNQDFGNYTAEDYWVGENYVDWIGVDGYNWGKSQSWFQWAWPNEVFDDMIGRIRKLTSTKPLSINEYGTTSMIATNVSNIQYKTEWLNRFCDYVRNSQVKIASYLNTDVETDWAVFGGMHGDIVWNNRAAYTAYKNCLQSNEWIQPNITNERLITDDQFAGRL